MEEGPESLHQGPYPQIILFGDSITQHSSDTKNGFSYFAALSHAFQRRFDVINRGFSGYNSKHGHHVLPQFMPTPAQAQVVLLIICFGANDSCLPHTPTGHHVSLPDYAANLASIINNDAILAHKPHILLMTPPPVDEEAQVAADLAKGYVPRRSAANTDKYAQACREVGRKVKVPVVDLWTAFREETLVEEGVFDKELLKGLFSDGLHLSDKGYKIMFREVMKAIEKHYPQLMPERVPFVCPTWEVLNGFQRPE